MELLIIIWGGSGCIYGLAVAKGLVSAGIARNVLLLTAETYSKYLHPSDKSNRSIFGDGAAAWLDLHGWICGNRRFCVWYGWQWSENLIVKTGASKQRKLPGSSKKMKKVIRGMMIICI